MAFKRCSIGTKGPKVCIETRQDRSMLSCSLRQILTLLSEYHSRNRDSSDQATFFQSSIVQFWWACANCSLRFLFLADMRAPGVVFCCYSPSASGFDVLCIQKWYSANLVVIWVNVAFLSSLTSLLILLWPLSSKRHFCPHNCRSLDIFSFLDHSL